MLCKQMGSVACLLASLIFNTERPSVPKIGTVTLSGQNNSPIYELHVHDTYHSLVLEESSIFPFLKKRKKKKKEKIMKSDELVWQKSDVKEKKALRHGTSYGRCAKGRQKAASSIQRHGPKNTADRSTARQPPRAPAHNGRTAARFRAAVTA